MDLRRQGLGPLGRQAARRPATSAPVKPIYNAFDRAGIHDQSARRPADAELRLADMDRDGVQTQVIFGPIFQISTDDPVLREACYSVYNDWLMEFCGVAPDRLIGVPMLPETPTGALTELQRLVAKGGVRQVTLMIANINPKLDDPAWEGLWSALEDSGIILAWHITVFVGKPGDRAAGKAASVFENTKFFLANFLEPFVDLFAWGILERHPKLRIVMAEAGTGWLPWLIQELDYRHWRLWEAKEFWADKGGSAARNQAERIVQAADLRDLPGRLRGDVADAVLWRGASVVGIGLSASRQRVAEFAGRDRAADEQPDAGDAPRADPRQRRRTVRAVTPLSRIAGEGAEQREAGEGGAAARPPHPTSGSALGHPLPQYGRGQNKAPSPPSGERAGVRGRPPAPSPAQLPSPVSPLTRRSALSRGAGEGI